MGLFKKPERRPVRLSYGVPIPDHRSGGLTEQLVEGYQLLREPDSPYSHAMNIVSSSERIWSTLLRLAPFVGPECMAVIEAHREDAVTTFVSTAHGKERVLEIFGQYAFQLVHDGFTAFGIASHPVEVFVREHKEIRIDCQEVREIVTVLGSLGFQRMRQLPLLGTVAHFHADLGAFFDSELARFAEPLPTDEVEKYRASPGEYDGFRDAIVRLLEMTVQNRHHG